MVEDQKEAMKEAFVEGWKKSEGVEKPHHMSIRAAESAFERWYALNYE